MMPAMLIVRSKSVNWNRLGGCCVYKSKSSLRMMIERVAAIFRFLYALS